MPLRRRGDGEPRRGAASDLVVVGLANPGDEFARSRHNVGGDAVRQLAERRGATLRAERRQRCLAATVTAPVGRVTLAVPLSFMNESGASLRPLLTRTSLAAITALVVVHDELDLTPGRLQFKRGGGLAGHNGLRSIAHVLGTPEFARLRIGIGKPATKEQGTEWVLRPLRGASERERDETVSRAVDALELLLDEGFDEAQRRTNLAPRD